MALIVNLLNLHFVLIYLEDTSKLLQREKKRKNLRDFNYQGPFKLVSIHQWSEFALINTQEKQDHKVTVTKPVSYYFSRSKFIKNLKAHYPIKCWHC